jgi:signal transduction histidine kinase
MAVGIAFPLALLAGVGWYWVHSLEDRLVAARIAAAQAAAAHFDEELTGDLELLQRLAAQVGATMGDPEVTAEQKAVRDSYHHFRHREAIFLLDAARRPVADEPPGQGTAWRSALPLVEEVLRSGLPRLSGLVVGPRGQVVLELVAVRDHTGAVVGVAGGTFVPSRRNFEKVMRHLREGQTGAADLVDGTGTVVASTEPRRAGRLAECSHQMSSWVKEKRQVSRRCDGCHQERGVDLQTGQVITFVPLGSAGWGLSVRQSEGEALPTEGSVPWLAFLGILALQVVLAGAFAWGAARSVTQPVAVLTHEAERIASGELDWPIPDLGEDEVGSLGKALDRMRQSIRDLVARVEGVNEALEVRVAERTQALNQANAQLREREEARGQLLRKVITAQEDERKRVARELHDETSQDLAVLLMRIEAAAEAIRAGRAPSLEDVKALAARTLDEVHRLILDLRPSVLDDLGLVSAIRWYAERTLSGRGTAVRCEFGEVPRLPPEQETALFRLCQETITNVARHAQATQVLIEVGEEAGEIHVSVEDDGRGFDVEAASRREGRRPWGLLGIRERAELMGGRAEIVSSPGGGTRVQVIIPTPEERP